MTMYHVPCLYTLYSVQYSYLIRFASMSWSARHAVVIIHGTHCDLTFHPLHISTGRSLFFMPENLQMRGYENSGESCQSCRTRRDRDFDIKVSSESYPGNCRSAAALSLATELPGCVSPLSPPQCPIRISCITRNTTGRERERGGGQEKIRNRGIDRDMFPVSAVTADTQTSPTTIT